MSKQLEKIKQLIEKREQARLGGGEKAIQKQHDKGKYTARERVEMLLDKGNKGVHHVAFCVEDGVAKALAEVSEKGVRLIDEKPRKGAENLNIAFLHPKSTCGILTELCEH